MPGPDLVKKARDRAANPQKYKKYDDAMDFSPDNVEGNLNDRLDDIKAIPGKVKKLLHFDDGGKLAAIPPPVAAKKGKKWPRNRGLQVIREPSHIVGDQTGTVYASLAENEPEVLEITPPSKLSSREQRRLRVMPRDEDPQVEANAGGGLLGISSGGGSRIGTLGTTGGGTIDASGVYNARRAANSAQGAYLNEQNRQGLLKYNDEAQLRSARGNVADQAATASARQIQGSGDYQYGDFGLDTPTAVKGLATQPGLPAMPGIRNAIQSQEDVMGTRIQNEQPERDLSLSRSQNAAQMAGNAADLAGINQSEADRARSEADRAANEAERNAAKAQASKPKAPAKKYNSTTTQYIDRVDAGNPKKVTKTQYYAGGGDLSFDPSDDSSDDSSPRYSMDEEYIDRSDAGNPKLVRRHTGRDSSSAGGSSFDADTIDAFDASIKQRAAPWARQDMLRKKAMAALPADSEIYKSISSDAQYDPKALAEIAGYKDKRSLAHVQEEQEYPYVRDRNRARDVAEYPYKRDLTRARAAEDLPYKRGLDTAEEDYKRAQAARYAPEGATFVRTATGGYWRSKEGLVLGANGVWTNPVNGDQFFEGHKVTKGRTGITMVDDGTGAPTVNKTTGGPNLAPGQTVGPRAASGGGASSPAASQSGEAAALNAKAFELYGKPFDALSNAQVEELYAAMSEEGN